MCNLRLIPFSVSFISDILFISSRSVWASWYLLGRWLTLGAKLFTVAWSRTTVACPLLILMSVSVLVWFWLTDYFLPSLWVIFSCYLTSLIIFNWTPKVVNFALLALDIFVSCSLVASLCILGASLVAQCKKSASQCRKCSLIPG